MMDAEKMNKEVEETYSEVKKMFDRAVDSMKSQRDIVLSIVVENGELRKENKELRKCLQLEKDNVTILEHEKQCLKDKLETKEKHIDELIKRSADLAIRLHKAETEINTLKEGAAEGDKPKCFGDSEINDKCCYCDVFIECAILSGVKHGKP